MSSDGSCHANAVPAIPRTQAVENSINYFAAIGMAWRVMPRRRQILPRLYRGLTIPGQFWRYSGTLSRAGGLGTRR
jgi:hypothetical protein